MAPAQPAIANYDDQTADQVTSRLRTLSQTDLAKLEAYERDGQARSTVLDAIASLREREPWSGYDDMEVEEVNAALRERDGDAADRVLAYERRHKGRSTVIEYAERSRETSSAGSQPQGAGPRSKTRATGGRQPARTGSTAKSAPPKGQSKRRSSSSSASKTKASGSSRKANGASRSGSSRSSGGSSRSSGGSSRSSGGSSRSRTSAPTRARSSGSRSNRSAPARARNSGSRSNKGSTRSSGSGTKPNRAKSQSRNGMLGTVTDVASKLRGPAVGVGAAAAGVVGGMALHSRTRRKKVLGVPLPRSVSKPRLPDLGTKSVAKTAGKARKQVGHTSKRVSNQAERVGDQAKRLRKVLS